MTNTLTRDRDATLSQIETLSSLGSELVRVAVPDRQSAKALKEICESSPVPIVADIHFNSQLAILAMEAGASGVRINPGNIGGPSKVREVAKAAMANGAAIRVGVNTGSLDTEISQKFGRGPQAMVESALKYTELIEDMGMENLKVSLKASSVEATIQAARLWDSLSDIPQHLGVTEAGDLISAVAKSAVAMGVLLMEGIGDTIRVSITGDPSDEVRAAYEILRATGRRQRGVEFISCPTCGRCEIDLAALLKDVKLRLSDILTPIKVAVMGCVVNGPGEAKDADLGVAGSKGGGTLFVKGEKIKDLPFESLAAELEKFARDLVAEKARE
jgi:(E)-4-hydroxy-3-methylbut-2-enyl-diphosphate synthase